MAYNYGKLPKFKRDEGHCHSGPECPNCGSSNVEDYPEEDRMHGLAMFWFTGFPQATMNFRYAYRCLDCGYEW